MRQTKIWEADEVEGPLTDHILYIHEYHPYRGGDNPGFDDTSSTVLDLKDKKRYAVKRFAKEVRRLAEDGIAISIIPPHDPEDPDSGIRKVATRLAKSVGRKDVTECLARTDFVPQQATGTRRTRTDHLDSFEIISRPLIRDKDVLLLGDVNTTGTSMEVGKDLPEDAGAVGPRFGRFYVCQTVRLPGVTRKSGSSTADWSIGELLGRKRWSPACESC